MHVNLSIFHPFVKKENLFKLLREQLQQPPQRE